MKRDMNLISLAFLAILLALPGYADKPTEAMQVTGDLQDRPEPGQEQAVVGRVTFLEKNLFRYIQEAKDWSLAVRDIPVIDGDVFYSDTPGRSEFTFPNDSKIRLNDQTKIQIDGIKENLTAVYVNSGVARIQNRSAETVVKVETPFGQVLSNQPSAFDVYVGDSSTIVTGVNGSARFLDGRNNQYDVSAGGDSLVADQNSVASSRRYLDSRWDAWNSQMDAEARSLEQNPSPYLPPQLQTDSQVLANNGRWEQLTYEGETANYWTPNNVSPTWSPFTVGRWTPWYGEQLWIPYEPFGWVTHHHGGWIYYNGRWYWRPPIRARWRVVPWYPARVVWVNQGRYIGWVPLSVYEPYYGRRYWGPRTVIYTERVVVRTIEVHRYVNVNRVVVIDKEGFYNVRRRYETVRDVSVVRQVVNNGQGTPVMSRDMVRGANLKMEHHFASGGDISRKPRSDLVKEFEARRQNIGDRNENAEAISQRLQNASLKAPVIRSTPRPPIGKQERSTRRDLPETPRERQKQRQEERRMEASKGSVPGTRQDQQPLTPQPPRQEGKRVKQQSEPEHKDQIDPRQQRQREAELRRQQQEEHQVGRQRQQEGPQLQRQQQEVQRRRQQVERQKQQPDGKHQTQLPQQKQGQ